MKQYRVSFLITSDQLSTVISVLENAVEDFSINVEKPEESARGKRTYHMVKKGITRNFPSKITEQGSVKTLLEALANGPLTTTQAGKIIEKAGYKHNTASPALSRMKKFGLVESPTYGVYQLPSVKRT